MTDLDLTQRAGLPDALRVLLAEFPRELWTSHANFAGMVQFWLQRHAMFREVLDRIETETRTLLDRGIDPAAFAPRLSRYGGFFVRELHGHHHIEDQHYFPRLMQLDLRLGRGFELLEADHGAMDGLLNDFTDGANTVLRAENDAVLRGAAGAFLTRLTGFRTLLSRHLTDEEDIIVPVILKTGFEG